MKKWAGILLSSLLVMGCSNKVLTEKPNIAALPEENKSESKLRMVIIQQTAREYGAQSGLAWRSQNLNQMLFKCENKLNTIFNFNFLILGNEVLPPILTEGKNKLESLNEETILYADRIYQIVQMPKLITTPPSWKQYLVIKFTKPEPPNRSLLPKNLPEKKVWNEMIGKGWLEGIEQADQIFEINLNHLVRDFNGMILYHKLLVQNIVTPPFVTEAEHGIVNGGNELRINERSLRILSTTKFNPQSNSWKTVGSRKLNNRALREHQKNKQKDYGIDNYGK